MLFEFHIQTCKTDEGAALPKKVYLVPDVNAVVFHSPGRHGGLFGKAVKNLVLGLGIGEQS